jgi:hypothetical protein
MLHPIIYLKDFALRGRWSIATMVKRALACRRRRLEQKTTRHTMPRMVLLSKIVGLDKDPLRTGRACKEYLVDPML